MESFKTESVKKLLSIILLLLLCHSISSPVFSALYVLRIVVQLCS
ncbi:hypothetical protein SOVF_207940 [Spinacia oleracea]|nr:hypothetical protein SOVF_207940 [Spinacia oleracea]